MDCIIVYVNTPERLSIQSLYAFSQLRPKRLVLGFEKSSTLNLSKVRRLFPQTELLLFEVTREQFTFAEDKQTIARLIHCADLARGECYIFLSSAEFLLPRSIPMLKRFASGDVDADYIAVSSCAPLNTNFPLKLDGTDEFEVKLIVVGAWAKTLCMAAWDGFVGSPYRLPLVDGPAFLSREAALLNVSCYSESTPRFFPSEGSIHPAREGSELLTGREFNDFILDQSALRSFP